MNKAAVRETDQIGSEEYTIEKLIESIKSVRGDPRTELFLFFVLEKNGERYLRKVMFEDEVPDIKPDDKKQNDEKTNDKKLDDKKTDNENTYGEPKRFSLRDTYLMNLDERLLKNSRAVLRSLSDCEGSQHDIYLCDDGELPDELSLFLKFDRNEVYSTKPESIDIPRFNFLTDTLDNLRGYIAYLGTMEDGLTLFTQHYPVTRLKSNAFFLGISKNKKQFKRVDDMDILRITGKAHLLRIHGHTIALDLDVLERDLGFQKVTTDKARKFVNQMKEKWNFIANPDELDEIVNDYRLARKLARASEYSPVVDPPDLVKWHNTVKYFLDKQELRDIFQFDDAEDYGKKKVDLSTPEARKAFVSLLDDDYLESALSKSLYVASHKKTISAKKSSSSKKKSS